MAISALTHDGQLWVSLGRSRKETSWQSRQVAWSQLLKKFSETSRTNETYKEYMSISKDLQSEKKDVGGFVGGVITGAGGGGAQRLKKNIATRTLITLDIDYLTDDFWGTYTMLFDNAAALYSTHKHSPESPRLRLIMPLDRAYFPDQYEAISRKIAQLLNIECFDDSTFQRERLMYWPSTSKDGIFQFEYQDGPFLVGSEILSRYYDWKDTSQWPISSRVSAEHRQLADKQGDPMEKPGVIGAFCRAYSISEALDLFLSDIYTSTAQENRYTYVHGSTAAGLILYDDKFAYSHHGTDPVSGRLVNAFDLVRLHKFGGQDEAINPETPIQKRPSYRGMIEWALKDKTVVRENNITRLLEMGRIFEEGEDINWLGTLKNSKESGKAQSVIHNYEIIMENDPALKGKFYYDAFRNRDMIVGLVPWTNEANQERPFTDDDESGLRNFIETNYEIGAENKLRDAFVCLRMKNSRHPVREFLDGLQWDQYERLDSLFIDYFGAEDCAYTRDVTRKALIGAVARVMQPGIKMDNMLVLVGTQGAGKSSFIAKLGTPWYGNFKADLRHIKEAMEQLQGAWIIEMGELSSFKRSEIEIIKNFISDPSDRYRAPWGRRLQDYPRQCIFIGTTNQEDFLNDATGDRRFWPLLLEVQAATGDPFKIKNSEIEQIWAEAYKAYLDNESFHLSPEMEKLAKLAKEKHTEEDFREGLIRKHLDTKVPKEWYNWDHDKRRSFLENGIFGEMETGELRRIYKIAPIEIWVDCLKQRFADAKPWDLKLIKNLMARIETWEPRVMKTGHYGTQRGYSLKPFVTGNSKA